MQLFLIDCFDVGITYISENDGSEFWKPTNESQTVYDCQRHCSEEIGCNFFTWQESSMECKFLYRKGTEKQDQDYVSGPKHCGM